MSLGAEVRVGQRRFSESLGAVYTVAKEAGSIGWFVVVEETGEDFLVGKLAAPLDPLVSEPQGYMGSGK